MANDNAVIMYEASQNAVDMAELIDDGNHQNFKSFDDLWSNADGAEAVVRPDGLITGATITPSDTADQVAVAALTCYQAGILQAVSANPALAIARPTDDFIKYSIVINDSQTIVALAGTESDTALANDRGVAGGPPIIPVGQIEIGQVHISNSASAVFTTSEIKQIAGSSQERFDFPTWEEKRINVEAGILTEAGIEFNAPLPTIHTGNTTKSVYASYFEPEFAEIPESSDFVPPETTHSTSSKQIYGKTLGSTSESLNQGSFTAYLKDGISDAILSKKNQTLFFKFKPDRLKTPYILTQGKFGVSRTFPAGDNITAACTVSATESAVEVTS